MAGSRVAANPFSASAMIHKPMLNETARDAIKALLRLVLKEELRRRSRSGMPILPHFSPFVFPSPIFFFKVFGGFYKLLTYLYLLIMCSHWRESCFQTSYKIFQNIILSASPAF